MTMPLTLLSVCEDMFQLNVLCRARKNSYHELSYELKNALVKYLYETGHCIESILHHQDYECWSCGGSGEYYRGVTCYKCGGSGVYRRVWHYAFRFEVDGRRFSWHQPKDLVEFHVQQLTGHAEKYHDPALPDKDDIAAFYARHRKAIWRVALFLWLRGHFSIQLDEMPYIKEIRWRYRIWRSNYIICPLRELLHGLRNRFSSWRFYNSVDMEVDNTNIPDIDDIPF